MKTLTQIIIALFMIGLTSCEQPENSPPYGPTSLNMSLIISDKDGNNLILDNVTVDKNHNLTSPYTLVGICNGKTKKTEIYADLDKVNARFFIHSDLHSFNYGAKGSLTGIIIYKLQLPSVFGDDRETIIEVSWQVEKITDWEQSAAIEKVRINDKEIEYIKGKPVIMVLEK